MARGSPSFANVELEKVEKCRKKKNINQQRLWELFSFANASRQVFITGRSHFALCLSYFLPPPVNISLLTSTCVFPNCFPHSWFQSTTLGFAVCQGFEQGDERHSSEQAPNHHLPRVGLHLFTSHLQDGWQEILYYPFWRCFVLKNK